MIVPGQPNTIAFVPGRAWAVLFRAGLRADHLAQPIWPTILMASRKPRHVYSGIRRRACTTPGEPIELPALPVSLARSHGACTACSRARPPPRDGLLAPSPAVTGHTADDDRPLVKQFYYYSSSSSQPPSTPPGGRVGYAYPSCSRRLRRTGARRGATKRRQRGRPACHGAGSRYRFSNGPPGPSPMWPSPKRPRPIRPDKLYVPGRVGIRA